MVALEAGSDIGGSIRVPAHLCGVFGHKPTYGIVPLKGHGFPGTDAKDVPIAVVGPMARSAPDLAIALDVLAGPLHPGGWHLALAAPRHRRLADYRVLVLDALAQTPTDSGVLAPLHDLVHELERVGAEILRGIDDLPDFSAAGSVYGAMLRTITTRGAPGAKPIDAHAWMELEDAQMRLERSWRKIFERVDVALSPPFGVAAFPHDATPDWAKRTLSVDGKPTPYGRQFGWPSLASLPNLPATVAPIAKTAEGLPVGVHIMAGAFEDRTAIAFAALLEREGLARCPSP
jgi:amidase